MFPFLWMLCSKWNSLLQCVLYCDGHKGPPSVFPLSMSERKVHELVKKHAVLESSAPTISSGLALESSHFHHHLWLPLSNMHWGQQKSKPPVLLICCDPPDSTLLTHSSLPQLYHLPPNPVAQTQVIPEAKVCQQHNHLVTADAVQALLQNVIQLYLDGDSDAGVDEKSDCSAESDVDGVDILSGESDLRYSDVEINDFGITPSG